MSKTKVSKIGRRGKIMLTTLVALMFIGVATAQLLPHFGKVTTTVEANQTILVDGQQYPDSGDITDVIPEDHPGGETFCFLHWLENKGSVPIDIELNPGCSGTDFDDPPNPINCNGITTTYYKLLGFSDTKITDATTISVEDLGVKVKWTITIDWDKVPYGASHAATALIIGDEGNNILCQIHNNDGVDPAYGVGTWLYSKYEDGWYTGGGTANNILVSDLDWVEASGGLEIDGNIIIITVDKTHLAFDEFKWVLRVPQEFTHPGFDWGDTDMTNTHTATVGEEIPKDTPFTMQSGELLNFYICYSFDKKIYPGIYTIVTTIT